ATAAVGITLAANGHPAAALARGEAPNANAATTAATPPRTRRSLRSLPATRRRLSVLPRPLATMHREHDHRPGVGRASQQPDEFLNQGQRIGDINGHCRPSPLPPRRQRGALAARPPQVQLSGVVSFDEAGSVQGVLATREYVLRVTRKSSVLDMVYICWSKRVLVQRRVLGLRCPVSLRSAPNRFRRGGFGAVFGG